MSKTRRNIHIDNDLYRSLEEINKLGSVKSVAFLINYAIEEMLQDRNNFYFCSHCAEIVAFSPVITVSGCLSGTCPHCDKKYEIDSATGEPWGPEHEEEPLPPATHEIKDSPVKTTFHGLTEEQAKFFADHFEDFREIVRKEKE